MPPLKKREKEAAAAAAVTANGAGGGAAGTASAVAAASAASAHNTTAAAAAGVNTAAAVAAETTKLNGHQQEQELFLQAFEKPTQIYRFLRNRHGTSPIFLNRTLSYMKDRMSRNNKKRATFKVNTILDSITKKSESVANNYLNVIYSGLFDKSAGSDHWWNAGDVVCVESTLYKITKSKRKDSTSDFQEILTHSSNVIYNPHDDIGQFSAISIPVQSMRPGLGEQNTIYKLLFRIKISPKFGGCAKNDDNDENGEIEETTPNAVKRSKSNTKIYGCELIVFEKNIGCIPEGDYEAALQELSSSSIKSFSPKKRTWETLPDNYIPLSMKFDVFNQFPTLKFRLTWSATELPASIEAKDLKMYGGDVAKENCLEVGGEGIAVVTNGQMTNGSEIVVAAAQLNGHVETQINHNNNCIKSSSIAATAAAAVVKAEKIQIVYNFLYSNNTRQQTEYTQEVICPWCGLDCLRLYALLKHLKLCHARFNFTYQPAAGNGARIDVTINDTYDGSYAGSPYDLAGPSGCSFARTCGPVRRTTVTNLLVCRPRRQKTSCLDEFLVLDEDDLSNQRPYITGHNRLYHHTETCLPVHPKELDIDSEGESDPLWLRQKTIQMIDEFSDVNEGEKELMKLWNLHVMKHGYVGDCQLPLACEMFLDTNGHEIIRKNLYRNFILHMCSLLDYGLLAPESVYKTVQRLQGMLSKFGEGRELMSQQRTSQLKYWLDVGIHKQDEQKLKSPQKQAPMPPSQANAAVSGGGESGTKSGATTDQKTTMHPPAKRSAATAVKRASMHPQSGIATAASTTALANGATAVTSSNKSVAKKSATQEEPNAMSSKRGGENSSVGIGSKRNSSGAISSLISAAEKTSDRRSATADAKTQAVKRRLSVKDVHQPASKRSRGEHIHNYNSSAASATRSTHKQDAAAVNSSSTSSTTTNQSLPKRLITRRQSIAGTNAADIANSAATTTTTTNTTTKAEKAAIGGKATHSLRTRLSVPLTKVDKR